jgi:FkbM family methyltransferase
MSRQIATSIRDRLPYSVRKYIGRIGRFVSEATTFPSMEGALTCLRDRGFQPGFAVDVGAYLGEWTTLFKRVFPRANVLMIEAQEQKRELLQSVCDRYGPSVELRLALLGASSGREVRFVEMETGSSVYEEQSPYDRRVTQKTMTTLDDLLAARVSSVDFLKLDVQGYELEVLRGASQALGHAQAVLMEASLVPINRGCPLIGDVIQFMNEAGYRLMDFCSQIRRRDGVLWQTDLLFVRSGSGLLPDAELTKDNWG